MPFEINVSKNGQHYFATHARSLTDKAPALKAWEDFKKRFPKSEGFAVSLTEYTTYGTTYAEPDTPDQ